MEMTKKPWNLARANLLRRKVIEIIAIHVLDIEICVLSHLQGSNSLGLFDLRSSLFGLLRCDRYVVPKRP